LPTGQDSTQKLAAHEAQQGKKEKEKKKEKKPGCAWSATLGSHAS
jgi:hypothetical protein